MWKKTLFIGGIILLSSVFFVGCTPYIPESEQNGADQIMSVPEMFMVDLQEYTSIDFSEIESDALVWNHQVEEQIVSNAYDGYVYMVKETTVKEDVINEFFDSRGFEMDFYNAADGVYVGQVGFVKGNQVCTVLRSMNSEKLTNELDESLFNYTVRCAEKKSLIGGDKDAHGCLVGAGYTWCELKEKCLRTWEEACE